MDTLNHNKYSIQLQYAISILSVIVVSGILFIGTNFIGYKIVALLLLFTVSVLAMLFDIFPVLIASLLSAVIWNFFFIPPIYTFHIDSTEDVLMFFMYFVVALVNAVLTYKIKQQEKKVRDKEEKEKTIKLYNTLFNSLSHELKTPIATIIGAVDTIKENQEKLSIELQHQLLTEMDLAGVRLNRQVENLLNMSRLETGLLQPKYDWCDINELIFMVINPLDKKLHHIQFEPIQDLPLFKFDSGILEQIIYNLVHNAILYTPNESTITISAFLQNNHLKISVSDNGAGFPESEIPFVFDKFYRLPNTKAGGTGLGLSIVKGFTEALRGKIILENNSSGGAVFELEFPFEISYLKNLKNE